MKNNNRIFYQNYYSRLPFYLRFFNKRKIPKLEPKSVNENPIDYFEVYSAKSTCYSSDKPISKLLDHE